MKNLSAFPRFPLSEALMILITLVVCLAGFTKAEVNPNYRKQGRSLRKNENFFLKEASFSNSFPDTHQASEMRDHELRGKHFFNLKNFPESFLDRPIKRQSDYFGDSSDSESEKESDGYGYDDDEYYHFNYKRNDEPEGKIDTSKIEKENLKEPKNYNMFPQNNQKINNKDDQHIEMLSYKESHPVAQQEPNDSSNSNKNGESRPNSPSLPSLSGADFKENSAINENNKERNKQAEPLAASESKISEPKQNVKATDAKDSNKLYGSKLTEDSEKKDKQVSLKSGKESGAEKSLNENTNISEDKDKTVKLTDNAKLKDNIEKISNSKSKVSESVKLTKEDKDVRKLNDKINSDLFDTNTLSEISNGASFVGNDYKDNLDVLKSLRSEGDTRPYGESPESDKSMSFGDYTKEAKDSQDRYLKDRRLNALKSERNRNYELLVKQSSLIRALQGSGKSNTYGKSANYDFQPTNNIFKKPWRDSDKISTKFIPESPLQVMQQMREQQQTDPSWNQMKHTLTNIPASELENTDYHKNFVKSLKKYKSENIKNSSSDGSYYMGSKSTSLYPKIVNKKKKRSKSKKRRSMGSEKNSEDKYHSGKMRIRNKKRTAYSTDDSFADTIHECLKNPNGSPSLNIIKTNKEETNPSDRKRRKSSSKVEYEIQITNQKQPEMKSVKFSHSSPNRLKKEAKTKIEDKYLKKYPYSQVSRDELTKMSNKRDLSKFKRKASIWKRDNQKSNIQTRAVPSGYYSNRVKFGQKNYVKSNEKAVSDPSAGDLNRLPLSYFSNTPSESNKDYLQRSWENNQLDYAYEPGKRFDENDHLNLGSFPNQINPINPMNPPGPTNSLLLLKKDDRLTKVLQDYPSKSNRENEVNPSQIAKILPQDKNYVVFKNPDADKLQKNGESESYSLNNEVDKSSYGNKQFPFLNMRTSEFSGWSNPLKTLHVRSSYNSEKNDNKFSSSFHDSGTDSNLNKAIDKFRDMTDFFQDSEQENSNNRYLIQEAKGKPDIVFSQDKLPDPIIINHEETSKEIGMKQEPVNSIYAISNNFRNLDQQSKKFEYPETKFESPDVELKPSLKQAFPEAVSVNSVKKNGNEIIVLDLNGNPLKLENERIYRMPQRGQGRGMSRLLLVSPNQYLVSNAQEASQNEASFPAEVQNADHNRFKMNLLSNDRAVAIIKSADNQRDIIGSLHELSELPEILKTIMIKVPIDVKSESNLLNKQNMRTLNEAPQNYNYLFQDFAKAPGMKTKKETLRSSKNFPYQSFYSNGNLGNVLQSLLNPSSFSEINFDRNKNLNGNQKAEQKLQNVAMCQPNYNAKQQNLWSVQEKSKNLIPFSQEIWENSLKPSEEISNILRIDGSSFTENNNENKLRKELAAASEKIHRLRREGMEAGKLRKTIEDALAFKETQDSDESELKGEEKNKKYNSETTDLKSDDKALAQEAGNEKNLKSQLKEVEETKEGAESESRLSELLDDLNSNKNQKNSKENTWNKKKRMDTSRRKRFSKRDLSSKVSKTEVQNKVVQSLVEDNDESVYSPGLKRKLLSTSNEMEDSDSYSDANQHEFNVKKPVENEADGCMDWTLVTRFSVDDSEAEKNRERRSAFHSNFKREIDLDESMPNDFQNFLMTSLGGFGSQKREVVKKGEALWEGKEMTQDNYNQIVENGKDANEDSALEKREVSSSENLKSQNYKTPAYYTITSQEPRSTSITRADKAIRSIHSNIIKRKPAKFTEEKLPTSIRIQISNTSAKEKKSSKPIMEENETTSTEMENLPKEKEFFDKNKVNPLLSRNFNKLRQHSGVKYSNNEYDDSVSKDLAFKRKPYRPYWWEDRIRKKSTGERSMRFNAFDENADDPLSQNQQTNSEAEPQQKVPMITRLPQVETVYNPTQGANKAQIERSRLGKANSVKSKSLLSTKNNLKSDEAFSYDDGFLKSYLKGEEMKTDKGGPNYGDPQWKIFNEKISYDQEPFGANSPSTPGQIGESASFSGSNMSPIAFNNMRGGSSIKWPQSHYSGFAYHNPPNMMNSQVMFDVMKLKQQMKNHYGYDNYDTKQFLKPAYSTDSEIQDNLLKNKGLPSSWVDSNSPVGLSNNFDFPWSKKTINDYSDKNFEIKNALPKDFGFFKHTYLLDGSNAAGMNEKPGSDSSTDNSKEKDYIDGIEDEYPEMDAREPQPDDMYRMFFKDLNKAHEAPNYRKFYNYKSYKNGYKSPEPGTNINGNDKEFFEEYEENGEDADLEDYSQLGYQKDIEPQISRFSHDNTKVPGSAFRSLNNQQHFNPFSQGYKGSRYEGNMNSRSESNFALPVENFKNEADPVSGSNSLLKKANEKSNIFGKNLMKTLYGTTSSNFPHIKEKPLNDAYHFYRSKLSKRNYPSKSSPVGSRVYYAAKVLSENTRNLSPNKIFFPINKRNTYYRLSNRNPFNAEFAGGENDFEPESEERGMRFNDNFVSLEKNGQNEKNSKGFSERLEKVKDVEENVEDGGENNVLENIIGKYIMRKRIINSNDLSKTSEKAIKLQDNEKTTSDDSCEHKITKRCAAFRRTDDQAPKVLKKRRSSGHLTENNFRKYHKKNFTKKRHVNDLLSIPYTFDDQENMKTGKSKEQIKRSALDIFKKITNKEKEKRLESSEGRSAGFEPLMSLSEKSKGFIKDNKDTNLFQEKTSSKETPQSELRSSPPELKAHYPNEGQRLRAQIADRKKAKAKELDQVPLTKTSQGPWKVELNSKYDLPDLKLNHELKDIKEEEKTPVCNPNGRYKAFLVISNNANAAEQSAKSNRLSVSKFFNSDSSSSYWPNFEECLTSTNHVRKRSLKPPADDKETKEILDKTVLQNTKRLSEENPKLSAPQVVEKSTEINRDFVTDSRENRNGQLFSKGKLINRKSVLPPSSDSNIIRDSRHINEETSEFHSQRIVDAILSQVSENSQFKKLIAPGLAMRTSAYKEGIDSKSKSSTEVNFPNEFQSFFKKFMFDLENLTEQHVQKRMCKKIDNDLKEFLQSLLIPVGNANDNEMNAKQEKYSFQSLRDTPQAKNLSRNGQNAHEFQNNVYGDLKKKQHNFKKIVEKYQTLSKVKKDTQPAENPYILQDANEMNKEGINSKNLPYPTSKNSFHLIRHNHTNRINDRKGLNSNCNETKNTAKCHGVCQLIKSAESKHRNFKSNPGSNVDLKPVAKTPNLKQFPVFCFYKMNNPDQNEQKTTTSSYFYQNTVEVNATTTNRSNCYNFEEENQNEVTPPQPNTEPTEQTKVENVRIKDSLFNTGKLSRKSERGVHNSSSSRTKLGLGDAAGLFQLAFKNQNSLVSNLETDKTLPIGNVSQISSNVSSQPKGTRVSQISSALCIDDLKNPQTFANIFSDYPDDSIKNRNAEYCCRPALPGSTYRRIFHPKVKPFNSVSSDVCCRCKVTEMKPAFVLVRIPKPLHAPCTCHTWHLPPSYSGLQVPRKRRRERKLTRKTNMVPRFPTHHLKEVPKN